MGAKTICFINMKGGVGKTTLSVNIGYTLAKHLKKKVLMVDLDPQMNASQYTLDSEKVRTILECPQKTVYGIFETKMPSIMKKEDSKSVCPTEVFKIIDGFSIIPSHLTLMLSSISESPLLLKNYLKEKASDYDVIIIDAPPTMSGYTKAALLASDSYIVPMKIDFLSLFGLPLLQNYISGLEKEYGTNILFKGIVLTMVRTDYKIYQNVKEKLEQKNEWKQVLFNNELTLRTQVANALSPDKEWSENVFIYNLDDKLKNEIVAISQEFMQKIRL